MLVNYTDIAQDDLTVLDASIAKRVVRKIERYSETSDPLMYAKRLTGNLSGLYRYRIGDYRAVFELDANGNIIILNILSIKHRKDIYR